MWFRTILTVILALLAGGPVASASAPVEIGANDFRISQIGPDGDPSQESFQPAVAYSALNHEYLVAWEAVYPGGQEIFVQRIDAATGAERGVDDLRITDFAGAIDVGTSAVAYNPDRDEYLVVFAAVAAGQTGYHLYGQLLDGATGEEVGFDDLLLTPSIEGDNWNPAVVYNPVEQDLAEIGFDDFQISQTPNPQLAQFWSAQPALAYDPEANRFLVVFQTSRTGVGNTPDVYGRTVLPTSGPIGTDFLLSWPPDGIRRVSSPALAFVPEEQAFLVVWTGREPLAPDEVEVYSRLVEQDGGLSLVLRLSDIVGTGASDVLHRPKSPALAAAAGHRELLAVWQANDIDDGLHDTESEIFGQRLGWTLFADGFESGDLSAWSAPAP